MSEQTQIQTQESKPLSFSDGLMISLESVSEALPVGFNKMRFVQEAVSLMNENKQLSQFAQQHGTGQIKLGMMKAAYLGLSFMNKEAYLIPYGSQLNFMTDYKGNRKLAKKYSPRKIKEIYAKVVKDGDKLELGVTDGKQTVDFKPLAINDGDIIGAFAVCEYEDGGLITEVMTKKEIEKARSKSRSGNGAGSPWVDFYGEMAKKTVLHRLCKMIDLDFESAYQREIINEEFVETASSDEVEDIFDTTEEGEVVDSE